MATHDYVIANASGAAVRQDINNALAAIVSNNSSANAPATTYAFQFWFDTTNNILKIRNAANSAWIDWITTTATVLLPDGAVGSPSLTFASETDTGLYKIADNTLGIATSGTERVEISDTGIIVNEGGAAAIDVRIEGDNEANLVFIDAGNDRIGIGDGAPGTTVEVASAEPRITVRNSTEEDADNGRESRIIFEGEQTGGEISTLAEIEASHEGTGDDERGQLIFRVNDGNDGASPTEAMRIHRSGQLLVGAADEFGGTVDHKIQSSSADGARVALGRDDTTTAADNVIGQVGFWGNDENGTFQEVARIETQADLDHATGDKPGRLVFSTTADGAATPTERLRITSDGTIQLRNSTGIDFSQIQTNAAGMTSETLDSYEEGTYDPVFSGSSSAGTYTYNTRTGHYTKIGEMVNVTVKLTNINTSTAGSGNVNISLPFSSANNSSFVCGSVVLDQFNTPTSTVSLTARNNPNSAVLEILCTRDNATDEALEVTDKSSNTADIFCTITYRV